ncbi:MAG: hypothetical protein KatS3mg095_0616 [Candidatus Parcubacteria bacterium]|nr:MAG: hypothetical protein KatS3mg095_0616 [Candidatus Parcubacteria bacterium]
MTTNKKEAKLLIILVSLLIINNLSAQVFSINPDQNFRINLNNEVYSIVTDPRTNIVYIGGNFNRINFTETGPGIIINTNNGQLVNFPKINFDGIVHTVIPDGNGGWYVGGEFSYVNGLSFNNLFHILSNGEIDQNFKPDPNGAVFTLAISSSTLYVGGNFTIIGGQTRDKLAALNLANKGVPLSFSINHPNNDILEIRKIVIVSSTMYIAGSFSAILGTPRSNIAALDLNGNLLPWQTPEIKFIKSIQDQSLDFSPLIRTIAVDVFSPQKKIFVGGIFNQIGTTSIKYLAAFDLVTGNLLNSDFNLDGPVYDIEITPSVILIGGQFNRFINNSVKNLIVVSPQDFTNLLPFVQTDGPVFDIEIALSTIYIVGDFSKINNQQKPYVAALTFAEDGGANILPWSPLLPDSSPKVVKIFGNNLYLGGQFIGVGGENRNCLIAVNGNNGQILNWNPNLMVSTSSMSCNVNSLALTSKVLYVGGFFNYVGSSFRNNLAAFDVSNGNPGNLLNWSPNPNDQVNVITVTNQNVYVGGSFTNIGGQSRNNVASFNIVNDLPGTINSWNPNLGPNSNVKALTVFLPSGSTSSIIFIGGLFESVNNQAKFNLVAVDVNGNLISNWNPDPNDLVKSLYIGDSTLYIGGSFDTISGQTRKSIASFDLTQSPFKLNSWNPDFVYSLSNPLINSILKISNSIYVGGLFTKIGDQNKSNLASFNALNGNLLYWSPILDNQVNTLASLSSSLYVGGYFNLVNNNSFFKVAKFNFALSPQISNIKLNNTYNNNSTLPANTNQVTLTFNTDKNAICRYSTTANTSFDNMTNNITTNNGLSHSTTFSNLQNNTSYTYYLRCQDATNPDLKNTEDYVVNFSIAQVTTGSSGGGGGGFTGGGGGGGSRVISPSTTTTTSDEALRLWLLQFVNQLLSQKQTATSSQKQTTITPTFKSKIKGIPDGFQFTRTLKFGMKGQDVKYLQIFLRAQGKSIYPERKVTGTFGGATRKAVIRFQEKYKKELKIKKADGIVQGATLRKINNMIRGKK